MAATLGISILVLIFAELTPKNIAVRRPSGVAVVLARPVRFFAIILRPVIFVLGGVVVDVPDVSYAGPVALFRFLTSGTHLFLVVTSAL